MLLASPHRIASLQCPSPITDRRSFSAIALSPVTVWRSSHARCWCSGCSLAVCCAPPRAQIYFHLLTFSPRAPSGLSTSPGVAPGFLISSSTSVVLRLPFHRLRDIVSLLVAGRLGTLAFASLNTGPIANIDAPREIKNRRLGRAPHPKDPSLSSERSPTQHGA